MTHSEINRRLALAIGWRAEDISPGEVFLYQREAGALHWWQKFDFKDWHTIAPIAERYDCFPIKTFYGRWKRHTWGQAYDTPQEAIAWAVIGDKA